MLEKTLPAYNTLKLQQLSLWVRLGCTPEERLSPQEVRIDVSFRFKNMPIGAASDRLEETICYAEVSNAIQEHCESKEFNLIEKIGADVYRIAKQVSHNKSEVSVSAHKVKPPVHRLTGGAVYSCGDFIE